MFIKIGVCIKSGVFIKIGVCIEGVFLIKSGLFFTSGVACLYVS